MPTLTELENLDKFVKAVEKLLEDQLAEEAKHFEEWCELEVDTDTLELPELEKVAKENGQLDHTYIAMARADNLIPFVKAYIREGLALQGPMVKYSTYFNELKEKENK